MARTVAAQSPPALTLAPRLRRGATNPPLYRQVCDRIEELAMSSPLGDEQPLPPESQLLERFGVSRGTLRRATEELAREGLLRIEPGRGTFVVQATKVRWLVWDRLAEVARPDSRFDDDLSSFIPDFEDSELCIQRLRDSAAYRDAGTIFIAPDNSLQALREQALGDGKRVLVPTYGMRRGFVLLNGAELPASTHALAATLDGMERNGTNLTLTQLRALEPIGLVVTGAVAVTNRGLHFGFGNGFFDLEWGLLRHCSLTTSRTPVVVIVHDCQVLDADIRPSAHDAVADLIITPAGIRACEPSLPKPEGIFWDEIRMSRDEGGPYVRDLLAEHEPPRPRARRPIRPI
jgi:5-formyltetrahydrofolate cyclo-ligase